MERRGKSLGEDLFSGGKVKGTGLRAARMQRDGAGCEAERCAQRREPPDPPYKKTGQNKSDRSEVTITKEKWAM